jgi:riboflavin kinase/FMN adenylyltransferase
VDGLEIPAVTNIGFRPTFEAQSLRARVETHLLDFDQDLYQRQISLSFEVHLRDEQRFTNIQALIDQVQQDIRYARSIYPGMNHQEAASDETIPRSPSAHP